MDFFVALVDKNWESSITTGGNFVCFERFL